MQRLNIMQTLVKALGKHLFR